MRIKKDTIIGIEIMEGGKLPKKANKNDTGYDVYLPERLEIPPGKTRLIPLCFKLLIPEGYYIEIVPRSSLPKMGLAVTNSPGIIDQDYRGEIHVWLTNIIRYHVEVQEKVRIAQLILRKRHDIDFVKLDKIDKDTDRGIGRHGSSGK